MDTAVPVTVDDPQSRLSTGFTGTVSSLVSSSTDTHDGGLSSVNSTIFSFFCGLMLNFFLLYSDLYTKFARGHTVHDKDPADILLAAITYFEPLTLNWNQQPLGQWTFLHLQCSSVFKKQTHQTGSCSRPYLGHGVAFRYTDASSINMATHRHVLYMPHRWPHT